MKPLGRSIVAGLTLVWVGAFGWAVAAMPAAAATPVLSGAPEQRATGTPRPNLAATATAIKATAATGATRVAATATALKATATARKATVTPPAKVDEAEAAEAITAYAANVLGLEVNITKAGGLTGQITRTLSQTPGGSGAQSATAKLAGVAYGAVLSNGAATLSYGSGTLSGDVNVDVQWASLGVYSLLTAGPAPANADAALALARATFPGVDDFTYTAYKVSKGWAWYTKGNVSTVDPKTRKVTTVAQTVVLYVVAGANGKVNVSATVGRGEFASQIKVP